MPAPETQARQALKAAIDAEFATEGFTARDDYLHESLGSERTYIGTSPMRSVPASRNNAVLEMYIYVQFYSKYKKVVDPTQSVSPATIEGFADRFRNAVSKGDPNTASVWYFQVTAINFPNDPTGNKTRFEATVIARGNNTALPESSV